MTKIQLENLVVLQFAQNNCYVQVIDINKAIGKEEGFSLNINKGQWSYDEWKDNDIGNSRSVFNKYSHKCKSGIIGVYDRTNIKHISMMVNDALEFTKERRPINDY
jgi:hypothetical protein